METQDFLQTLLQTLLDRSNFSTIFNSVMMVNTIIALASLAFFIFVIFYVYENAPKYNMNKFLWVAVVLFVPKYMGFMTYLIVTTIKGGVHNNHFVSQEPFKNKTNESKTINKKFVYKVLSVCLMIVVLVGAIYIVDREKLKPKEVEGPTVVKSQKLFKDEYKDFTGSEVKEIWFGEDGILELHYDSQVKNGDLTIGIYEYNNEPIEIFETDEEGVINIPLEKHRIYKLIAKGVHTKGYYDFSWEFNKNE
ncbi:hypothetical protein [Crassaminicella profunda]|uniref:hypothetical protein n=1 Tax=Crassaminicella profunda TaxID=1286698 RepID=UPI001CA6FD18|nr:hypothetical protein [Crassaminicella profunda]QZY54126.1 hypothetical protein K7H06_13855 [Crassaminicella profunda]